MAVPRRPALTAGIRDKQAVASSSGSSHIIAGWVALAQGHSQVHMVKQKAWTGNGLASPSSAVEASVVQPVVCVRATWH